MVFRKYITWVYLICSLFAMSCNSNSNSTISKSKKQLKRYFNFDFVEHYNIAITDETLYKSNVSAPKLKRIEAIIIDNAINSLSDTGVLSELNGLGFNRQELEQIKFDSLNIIFSEHQYDEMSETACEAVYRDILVFKKDNKITGIAKICFTCNQCDIINENKGVFLKIPYQYYPNLKVLLNIEK